jgi:hypothetical protein
VHQTAYNSSAAWAVSTDLNTQQQILMGCPHVQHDTHTPLQRHACVLRDKNNTPNKLLNLMNFLLEIPAQTKSGG